MKTHWRFGMAAMASAALLLVAACEGGSPLSTEAPAGPDEASPAEVEQVSAMLSVGHRGNGQLIWQLVSLMRTTAKYHSLDRALEDYPILVNNELTAPDGCSSTMGKGGMGYHYVGLYAVDDEVNYLEPELLVFAPQKARWFSRHTNARPTLGALEYFIPYSEAWPADGAPPTSAEMGLAVYPAVAFEPSRFGGWMFHIWLWRYNPAGIFSNSNPAVPLCEDSPY